MSKRFTREQIAETALEIADAEGFEALSMRRVAQELGAGTMTLYYYVRDKEDLLTLVEDALMGEICDACDPLPRPWRAAVGKLAAATRATYVRHAWAMHALTGLRVKPNGLRHVEQSLQAVAGLDLPIEAKHEILSIVDDYVFGHCAGLMRRRSQPQLVRKTARALSQAMKEILDAGDYPQLRAMIGRDDPVTAFVKNSSFMTEDAHFQVGLDALLDGLAKRFGVT
ncbi:MAG TPA: TetR/AcrR family transcriptional regulator C-terminal domain-containing protein [Polyangia bacterium]|nr:TetR/AcrR family transcriptional regulator C-terminal domain-containing protein [Polyangia bacterium]